MTTRRRVASLLFIIASILLPLSASAITLNVNSLLTNPGFDSNTPALGFFTDTDTDIWLQESAVLVGCALCPTTPENTVSPNQGVGMLRIQNTGGAVSQVRQVIIPVSVLSGDVAFFQMAFNSPEPGAIGTVQLNAYEPGLVGQTAPLLGTMSSGGIPLDDDPDTWETLSVTFGLPDGTTQLDVQVFFKNGTIPSNGYVDAVPEPSTLLLTALGLFGLAVRYRRHRGTGLG